MSELPHSASWGVDQPANDVPPPAQMQAELRFQTTEAAEDWLAVTRRLAKRGPRL